MATKPIPDGYHAITPYLIVDGAAKAIDFYKAAFGAAELFRFPGPDGRLGHAELRIGDSVIMLADQFPEREIHAPGGLGGSPVSIMLYTEAVDQVVERAVGLGAKIKRPVENQFYGDRSGTIEDPFGHQWHVATHVEDVSAEEMERRAAAQAGN
jgi:PhnB protein